jgi:hypothetical protein
MKAAFAIEAGRLRVEAGLTAEQISRHGGVLAMRSYFADKEICCDEALVNREHEAVFPVYKGADSAPFGANDARIGTRAPVGADGQPQPGADGERSGKEAAQVELSPPRREGCHRPARRASELPGTWCRDRLLCPIDPRTFAMRSFLSRERLLVRTWRNRNNRTASTAAGVGLSTSEGGTLSGRG